MTHSDARKDAKQQRTLLHQGCKHHDHRGDLVVYEGVLHYRFPLFLCGIPALVGLRPQAVPVYMYCAMYVNGLVSDPLRHQVHLLWSDLYMHACMHVYTHTPEVMHQTKHVYFGLIHAHVYVCMYVTVRLYAHIPEVIYETMHVYFSLIHNAQLPVDRVVFDLKCMEELLLACVS
jgi:hypothetical protein